MTIDRETLPQRRRSFNLEFTHEFEAGKPFLYRATVGLYNDGRVGELWLNFQRHTTPMDATAQDAAIAMSLALQYGCPLEVLRSAVARDTHGYPASPFGLLLDKVSHAISHNRDVRSIVDESRLRIVPRTNGVNGVEAVDDAAVPDRREAEGISPGVPADQSTHRSVEPSSGAEPGDRTEGGTAGPHGPASGN